MEALSKKILDLTFDPRAEDSRVVISQLVEATASNEDTTILIGPVMKLLPVTDLHVKKAVHHILPGLCQKHPQAAVLAVNSVLHDCGDPNPEIKCLGVHSLCAIPELVEHVSGVLQSLLADSHPRVRLAAVHGCRQLYQHTPNAPAEHGLIDILYSLVRDSDSKVSTTAILTLDAILAEEGGVVVTKAMARHLLKRLAHYPPAQLASVLQALAKYRPKEEAEIFEELSYIDPYLVYSQCSAVNVNCIGLFLALIQEKYKHLMAQLVERSSPSLIEYLKSPLESSALAAIEFLSSEEGATWLKDMPSSALVPNPNDSPAVKVKKLALVASTCRENEAGEILAAVSPFCHDSSCGSEAVRCICNIRSHLNSDVISSKCLTVLLQLLDSSDATIVRNTLAEFEKFNLDGISHDKIATTLEKIVEKMDLFKPETIPSVVPQLLGWYGETLPTAPYILEHLVNNYETLDTDVRTHLLLATIRLFLKRPGECQLTLGRLFQLCASDCDNALSSKATKYYKILCGDQELMKVIVGVS